jgi:hypothetical protein
VLVELTEDGRALDRLAQLPGTGGLQCDRPRDPDHAQAQARDEHGSRGSVQHSETLVEAASQVEAEHLQPRGEDAADHHGPEQGEQRRVGGLRAFFE